MLKDTNDFVFYGQWPFPSDQQWSSLRPICMWGVLKNTVTADNTYGFTCMFVCAWDTVCPIPEELRVSNHD